MKKFTINCDMGEGIDNDAEIMSYINYCNVACGGHSGDLNSMSETIELALKNEVKIGAHPSYPDKTNFGRKSIEISNHALIEAVRKQIDDLIEIARNKNTTLSHIKPHGALYNDIASSNELAQVFINAIAPYKTNLKLFVPYKSEIERVAIHNNFNIIYEVFADRNYNEDLSLVSRNQKNAVIVNLNDATKSIEGIINTGKISTVLNSEIRIKAETFCVHSDSENALEFVKGIKQLIQKYTDE